MTIRHHSPPEVRNATTGVEQKTILKDAAVIVDPPEEETSISDHQGAVVTSAKIHHPPRVRKRDLVRQFSLKLFTSATSLVRDSITNNNNTPTNNNDNNITPWKHSTRRRMEESQNIIQRGRDDAFLLQNSHHSNTTMSSMINPFYTSRHTDPTSYFYNKSRYKKSGNNNSVINVTLVPISWLKPHEDIVSHDRVNALVKTTVETWNGAYTKPLLVDSVTGTILDGHHRYSVGKILKLKSLPAVLVSYEADDDITLDVWPGCGRTSLTKAEVLQMAQSSNLFPPKTSKHESQMILPPISIPLDVLRKESAIPRPSTSNNNQSRKAMIKSTIKFLVLGAKKILTNPMLRYIFRTRLQHKENIKNTAFLKIRENDPTSSFCAQRSKTLDDLLDDDRRKHKFFYASRVTDPTSFFYKYRLHATHGRHITRQQVSLVNIHWLKPHEQVVSWEAVEKLRVATINWDAYTAPLLVDSKTGSILDGHHRHQVGLMLKLQRLPVVLVDYLSDDSISVDIWPESSYDESTILTKEDVVEKCLSSDLFPPKTTRHEFSDNLPPISVPLSTLRKIN